MTAGVMVLPAAKDVRDLLTGLVGKDVAVSPGGPVTPTPAKPVADSIRRVAALVAESQPASRTKQKQRRSLFARS